MESQGIKISTTHIKSHSLLCRELKLLGLQATSISLLSMENLTTLIAHPRMGDNAKVEIKYIMDAFMEVRY